MISAQAGRLSVTSSGCTRRVRCSLAQISTVHAQAGHLSPARLLLQEDHKPQVVMDAQMGRLSTTGC